MALAALGAVGGGGVGVGGIGGVGGALEQRLLDRALEMARLVESREAMQATYKALAEKQEATQASYKALVGAHRSPSKKHSWRRWTVH